MELATVKKGTPLYGQPSWWGEDEEEEGGEGGGAGTKGDSNAKGDGRKKKTRKEGESKKSKKGTGRSPRPSSLSLSSEGSPPAETAPIAQMEADKKGTATAAPAPPRPSGPTYMEIPLHDDDDDAKREATPERGGDKTRETVTPARSTVSSSLSKDSLFSPEVKQPGKGGDGKTSASPGAGEVKNPNMSFTVDLEDHTTRKVNMNTSLSEFVPSKIRRNFRDRKDRVTGGSRTGSKESTPSKTSEERELSPGQQKKIDEMWSSIESSKGKQSRLSSMQATIGSSSLRSPNLEDIDRLSELSEERRSVDRDSKDSDKKGASKRPISKQSPQLPRSSKVRTSTSSITSTSSATASSPQTKRAATSSSVNVSQYSDPTSYLIDKMFEGGTAATAGPKGKATSGVASPEHALYKESKGHDKSAARRASGSGKAIKSATAASAATGKQQQQPTKKSLSAIKSASLKKSLQASPCKLVPDDEDDDEDENEADKTKELEDCDDDDDLQITETVGKGGGGDGEKEKDDTEDKASEAGTYTIEADEKSAKQEEEEEEARKRIDQVFGVDVDTFVDKPTIDPLRIDSPGGYDNVYGDGDKTPLDETSKQPFPGMDKEGDDEEEDLTLDDDLTVDDDNDDEDEDEDLDVGISDDEGGSMSSEGGVQTWVSQLTALTSHKMAKDQDGSPTSKKPPQGLNRKRPGTGRKLPSIPTTDRSPVSSEHSSYVGDAPSEGHNSPAARSDLVINGAAVTSKQQAKESAMTASHPAATRQAKTNGHHAVDKKDVGSPPLSTRSVKSQGSVDTELLLQDTETVMAAMEARISHKSANASGSGKKGRTSSPYGGTGGGGGDSDTDVSSTVALANGDDDYVKPTLYKSPRDALLKRQEKNNAVKNGSGGSASSTPATTPREKKAVGGRTYSQTVASKARSVQSPRSVASVGSNRRTVVSDVFSRRDSIDNESIVSDVSINSDMTGDSSFSRSGSKGKGTITMTKPNRAFQLRRARADSADEPTPPRVAAKAAAGTSRSAYGSARSSSVHSAIRSRAPIDTGRSEASLGAQIVKKSRQNNGTQDKSKSSQNMNRGDGGRHSLRMQRASSLTLTQAAGQSHHSSAGTKRELGSKSPLRPTYSGSSSRGNLTITGSSSLSSNNKCHSQPGSRSNSPKSAERAAWKRRKEYDPRRAVAEAKAKSKDTTSIVTTRPKPSASSSYRRRMIRSASFTNPQELALSVQSSFSSSSSQDCIISAGNGEHSAFRRAFLPFHSSLRTDRSAFSADEDDSLMSNNTAQASYDSLIVSSVYQLSLKLSTNTDKTLNKLREQDRVSLTPSPIDDFLSDSGRSEITAWKSANQELAGVLKNLRKIERHVQMMNRVLFPEEDTDTEVTTGIRTGQEKQKYFQEIERIRNEIKGFQPIEPHDLEVASPEMAELGEQF